MRMELGDRRRGISRPRTCDRREEDGDEGEEDVGGRHDVDGYEKALRSRCPIKLKQCDICFSRNQLVLAVGARSILENTEGWRRYLRVTTGSPAVGGF